MQTMSAELIVESVRITCEILQPSGRGVGTPEQLGPSFQRRLLGFHVTGFKV